MIGPGRSKRTSLPGGWHNWLLAILCVAVIAFAVSSIGSSSADSASTQRTATVGRGVVQSTVSGNGSLEAAQQVELNFGASGEVTEIYVKAGEEVAKGEVLARIDSSSAQASLASAKAQLSEAEETLESAEEAAEEEEGEEEEVSTSFDATATTVLASYQPEGLSGEASATEAEEGKSATEKPAEEAGEKGSSGSGNTTPGKNEGGGKAGENSGSQTNPGKQEEGAAPSEEEAAPTTPSESTTSAPAAGGEESTPQGATVSVATAEANLREAQLSVKSARQEVRETTLRAPISGTIASVSGAVGETVSGESSGASSPASGGSESSSALGAFGGSSSSSSSGSESSSAFIVLSQLNRLKMEVSFSESDIGKIKVGQPATVSISSMEGTELAGKITAVDVLPGEGSSSVVEYPATITLTQNAKGVRAGMSASAEVVVEEVKNAVTVTSEAVASGPAKTVTVKEDSGKEVEKTVTTGLVGDETTQILSGLKPGETVVLPEVSVATGGGEAAGGLPELGAGGGFPGGGGGFPSGGFPGAP